MLDHLLLSLGISPWGSPGSFTGDMYLDLSSALKRLGPVPSGCLSSGDSILPEPFLVNKSPPVIYNILRLEFSTEEAGTRSLWVSQQYRLHPA